MNQSFSFPKKAFLSAMVLAFTASFPLEGADHRILSAGEESVFRVVNAEGVVEVINGIPSGPVLPMRPKVFLRVPRAQDVPALASKVGAAAWSSSGVGLNYELDFSNNEQALRAVVLLQAEGCEASPAIQRQKQSRFRPADPLFKDQWHLVNTGRNNAKKGVDLNILKVWEKRQGRGISIAVVDDGLEIDHPDLAANCFSESSGMHYDFNLDVQDPYPAKNDSHGTSVAGLLASPSNRLGGLGVAPAAKLAGLRLTGEPSDSEMEAKAFSWKNNILAIYNNSWGPSDDGDVTEAPEPISRDAILSAMKFGRGGRGNIFVWAAGNGRPYDDDSNYDGFANLPQTIAVGAVSDQGLRTSEGEPGANIVVVAPTSSLGRQGLVCTDLTAGFGYNTIGENDGAVIPARNYTNLDYTNDFGWTSGATPQISGVVALMLEANPRLGWRDVQEILIATARRVSPSDADWKKNGAGFFFNHNFGAGLVDAEAAVERALKWKNLAAPTKVSESKKDLQLSIPDNKASGVTLDFDLTNTRKHARLRVEHVQFSVSLRHSYRGDLKFVLIAPSGMRSIVQARREDAGEAFKNWTFMSVRHWGETSTGRWRLQVIDTVPGDVGKISAASLTIHGTRRAK